MTHHMKWAKAIVAGFLGILAMAIAGASVAPRLGMPVMDFARMLGAPMGYSLGLGWLALFIIGIVLALIYASFHFILPGPSAIRGAIFSLIPWVIVMVVIFPALHMPVFMGSFALAVESLALALVYGLIMGAIYGETTGKRS